MKHEVTCTEARSLLSAHLDGELDKDAAADIREHLESCSACREEERVLASVRRSLRAQPAEAVPDLSDQILQRVRIASRSRESMREWGTRARVAGIAAAVAALIVLGTSLPWVDQPPERAAASEVANEVRRAARQLRNYEASFAILERGWNNAVPQRRFVAHVKYRAPESFHLTIEDRTPYPGPYVWPRNDVELVANAHRWWLREPLACPTKALPGCVLPESTASRSVVRRQPFDGTTALPTDIVLPVETIGMSDGFRVVGDARMLGREAEHIATTYRHAAPLIAALQPGGSWRAFRPGARVDLWVDRSTRFPLRFEVGGDSGDPPALSVHATSFSQPATLPARLFAPPSRSGSRTDGGFEARPFGTIATRLAPGETVGLSPYRAGVTTSGTRVLSYVDGMTWLRVLNERENASLTFDPAAEPVRLGGAGLGYYQPAALTFEQSPRRRVTLYGARHVTTLESNLTRRELLRVASSVAVEGRRPSSSLFANDRLLAKSIPLDDAPTFVLRPAYLPSGYRRTSTVRTVGRRGTTVTQYFRRPQSDFEPLGVRITQSDGVDLLAPTSEDLDPVLVRGRPGRWSRGRGELEWIEHGIYRAVAAPSYPLHVVMAIARGLR